MQTQNSNNSMQLKICTTTKSILKIKLAMAESEINVEKWK